MTNAQDTTTDDIEESIESAFFQEEEGIDVLDKMHKQDASISLRLEVILGIIAVLCAGLLFFSVFSESFPYMGTVFAGITFTVSVALCVYTLVRPRAIRAQQTNALLTLVSETFDCFEKNSENEAYRKVCEILFPLTRAIAVAYTDRERIRGYVGYSSEGNVIGRSIRTRATRETIRDGKVRVIRNTQEIGIPEEKSMIKGAIVVPINEGKSIKGTLKFYYKAPRHITEEQLSLAIGFGQFLSLVISTKALEEQRSLAASMELKALQSQINPHFLFNSLNTIASFIRTDPAQARDLIRQLSMLYRNSIDDSSDYIPLEKELAQVKRYFSLELARFGQERLSLKYSIDEPLNSLIVPAFILQPLVENAVRHAMPQEGQLCITVSGRVVGNDAYLYVIDNGIGMKKEIETDDQKQNPSQIKKGLGIAVKNIYARIKNYYGQDSSLVFASEPGRGTMVTLKLVGALLK